MGTDYAFVHVTFTIPLAGILTAICKPLLSRLDVLRIAFLLFIAVSATIPWDSYLIRSGIWTYPETGVLGFSLFAIPVEELFFFVVQTYITALVYILCNKPVLHAQYLDSPGTKPLWVRRAHLAGQLVLATLTAIGAQLIASQNEGTYLGLILAWACPFAFVTWTLAGDMMLVMPWTSTLLPIMAPTAYLWLVDELSLRRGIWTISSGTKTGFQLFGSLDIEEAVFFLVTNTLVVTGIAAVDKAVAVYDAFPDQFPESSAPVPIVSLLKARAAPTSRYDEKRILGIREAVSRLRRKSRSFYLASSVFPGRLRIDLTLLYSFCRFADDLVDNSSTPKEAMHWILTLREYLKLKYSSNESELQKFIGANFPSMQHFALEYLPTHALAPEALHELLEGFETDLKFEGSKTWPIHDEDDMELYASRVASTIGRLCLDLVFHHTAKTPDQAFLQAAAHEMGIALQFVNIARDIAVDADIGRVYLPTTWLAEEKMTPEMVVQRPSGPAIERMRRRLLAKAFAKYRMSRGQMDLLPAEAKGPMIVAVESYMEIGRVLSEGGGRVSGRATVPAWRRAGIVWKTLMKA